MPKCPRCGKFFFSRKAICDCGWDIGHERFRPIGDEQTEEGGRGEYSRVREVTQRRLDRLRTWSVIVIVLGALGLLSGIMMDVSVDSPMGPVANLDKMNDRVTAVIAGGFLLVIGTLLLLSTAYAETRLPLDGEGSADQQSALNAALRGVKKECPMCAEQVQVRARICRYCGHQFQDVDEP
jgi:predicted RNA-binding Zn-ribbon protein involved in translation (DUF1610 family)